MGVRRSGSTANSRFFMDGSISAKVLASRKLPVLQLAV
jgi:hypothetical protein